MEKFQLQPGERVLKKGSMIYYPPETKDMGILRAAFAAKQCVGFLTSARLAGCTKLVEHPWGALIWLIKWLLGRKIIFQVSLATVTRVEKPEKGRQLVIKSADGSECTIALETFFDSRGKWMKAIADAVAAADPKAKINATDAVVEIARS